MKDRMSADEVKQARQDAPMLAQFPAPVRRLISMVDNLKDPVYIPDYDVEIVDAVEIHVHLEGNRALVIGEENSQRGRTWLVTDVEWDYSGSVDREGFVAEVTGYELGAVVKTYLERVKAEEAEADEMASDGKAT